MICFEACTGVLKVFSFLNWVQCEKNSSSLVYSLKNLFSWTLLF